jgi:hypothetical protein
LPRDHENWTLKFGLASAIKGFSLASKVHVWQSNPPRNEKAAAGGAGTWAALIQPYGWVAIEYKATSGDFNHLRTIFFASRCSWAGWIAVKGF